MQEADNKTDNRRVIVCLLLARMPRGPKVVMVRVAYNHKPVVRLPEVAAARRGRRPVGPVRVEGIRIVRGQNRVGLAKHAQHTGVWAGRRDGVQEPRQVCGGQVFNLGHGGPGLAVLPVGDARGREHAAGAGEPREPVRVGAEDGGGVVAAGAVDDPAHVRGERGGGRGGRGEPGEERQRAARVAHGGREREVRQGVAHVLRHGVEVAEVAFDRAAVGGLGGHGRVRARREVEADRGEAGLGGQRLGEESLVAVVLMAGEAMGYDCELAGLLLLLLLGTGDDGLGEDGAEGVRCARYGDPVG